MAVRSRATQVFNALKVLIWAVIAIALVKFAFFPSSTADAGAALDPSGDYAAMTTTPVRGDIRNTLSLKGIIEADAATTVKATLDGEVTFLYVADGAAVDEGAPLVEIRKQMPGEQTQSTDEEGKATTEVGDPWYKYATVTAPTSGTVQINALIGQTFAIGDPIAAVQPPTFSAVANLNADQMYRIQSAPSTATITIKNGPAPFECQDVKIETPKSTAASSQSQNDSGSGSGSGSTTSTSSSIRARCAIPGDQKVFQGLQVTIDMVAGEATDVLTVPVSAVEGRFQKGYVYAPGADGASPEKIEVELGITDGKSIEIKSGLSEGQKILEYIPGAKTDDEDLDGDGVPDSSTTGASTTGSECDSEQGC